MLTEAMVDKAICYYEEYGVVTEYMMQFQRSLTRKLFQIMRESECEGIENAIETEYVIYKNGIRDDYYEVIYNSKRFANADEVNDFLIQNHLHV